MASLPVLEDMALMMYSGFSMIVTPMLAAGLFSAVCRAVWRWAFLGFGEGCDKGEGVSP